MNRHRFEAAVTAIALVAAGVASAAGPASAGTPKETGCPSGNLLLSVSGLVAQGYHDQSDIDVNKDGYICGQPVAPAIQSKICEEIGGCTVPIIYWFRGDNDLTPAH